MQAPGLITVVNRTEKTFAERLKAARHKKGLSQAALAKLAGTSQGAIGNYENGDREAPRDVVRLAEALGVSPKWNDAAFVPAQA